MTAETHVDLGTAVDADRFDRPMAEIARWSVGTLVGLLWCAALLVGWRRLDGVLGRPLQPPTLLFVGALLAAASAGLRVWWHRLALRQAGSLRIERLMAILPTAAVLALGAALSLRGTAPAGLLAFWALLIGEESWAWRPAVWRRLRGEQRPIPTLRPGELDPTESSRPDPVLDFITDGVPAEDVLQQLTRSQAADGSELLSGWLRMRFAAGQRTANVHVAFCPPFAKTPHLTRKQLEGPSTRIKTAQLLPYGARLDLKLDAVPQQPENVLIRFSARSQDESLSKT